MYSAKVVTTNHKKGSFMPSHNKLGKPRVGTKREFTGFSRKNKHSKTADAGACNSSEPGKPLTFKKDSLPKKDGLAKKVVADDEGNLDQKELRRAKREKNRRWRCS
jgi:hypothetical protein